MGLEEVARELVRERYPTVQAAVLAGSTAAGSAGPSSDLDLVVVLAGEAAAFRETFGYDGTLVESFVHSAATLWQFIEREIPQRRSPLLHMCATGLVVLDEAGVASEILSRARHLLQTGPPALSTSESEDRRYAITALIDDLVDAAEDEVTFCATAVLHAVSELVILDRGGWLGRGKWLGRRLADVAPELADDLTTFFPSVGQAERRAEFVRAASGALASCGGRVDIGYRRP